MYQSVRRKTEDICRKLKPEDHAVQPAAEVSPPKWHLAHVTWFFETFILADTLQKYRPYNDTFHYLFNSYYKSEGNYWPQQNRGLLSRPALEEIIEYRRHVDSSMEQLLSSSVNDELRSKIVLGINHEEQHQELLLMDIKCILGANPGFPEYEDGCIYSQKNHNFDWIDFPEGVYEIGSTSGFCYDNETPRHKSYLYSFSIRSTKVTNREYLSFINDGGYSNPLLWLSKGWEWVEQEKINSPMYWHNIDSQWHEFTLYGLRPLDLDAPVTHISYFEADAFSRWFSCRLPTEQELELFLCERNKTAPHGSKSGFPLHPCNASMDCRQVWSWTQSHYSPYPRFQPFKDSFSEYNAKFMCGQFVLKGGCVLTPECHYRHSYRNFYLPSQRWMFSGLTLAKDN